MIKKILSLLIITSMILLSLIACNNQSNQNTNTNTEENNFDKYHPYADIQTDIENYVTLPELSGIEISSYRTDVTDEDFNEYCLDVFADDVTNVDVTDRGAAYGDYVLFDISSTLDEEIEGYETDYFSMDDAYVESLGDGVFIPGFQEALVNMLPGEEKTVHLVFPDDYSAIPAVAGVGITFTFTVKSIQTKALPELTDEYIASKTSYDSFATFKEAAYKELAVSIVEDGKTSQSDEIKAYLIKNSTFASLNSDIYDYYYKIYYNRLDSYAQSQGVDLETYCSAMGTTLDAFKEETDTYATERTKQDMIIAAAGKKLNVTITEEQYSNSVDQYVKEYEYDSVEKLYSENTEEVVAQNIYMDYVIAAIINQAVIK